ncbi:MAG: LruC domain-containing protein [Candidatus Marinimicrobia bacterium]|nr:LruC domain-containing protein [Candidatus Neomarinimicrobiota bacterium]MBT4362429.1 LruC domain-containing protein [Candidatus Neomarinimicrobiota bacterium]MBT4713412.1 LruC domain-containing protein [Candidatus Neomarinimicrobiota bacterium]MBT4946341.1 LruC domain-containing protein [Candidatus Neomarinimicrobiota bacterium]MBT5312990.1 LruC domain-containing protein [Candidatus Neomarinimicrobiota bacterium]
MKTKSIIYKCSVLVVVSLLLIACDNDQLAPEFEQDLVPLADRDMPSDFNYSTKQPVSIDIKARTNNEQALGGVKLTFFALDEDAAETELFSGLTDSQGEFNREVELPASLEQVVVKNNYIGLVNEVTLPIFDNSISYDYASEVLEENEDEGQLVKGSSASDYVLLSDYNSHGKPFDLVRPQDPIEQPFLNDVNSSLPEGTSVVTTHPDYLSEGRGINSLLTQDADVFVTFFHEGTSNKNVLGFYHFDTGNPPQTLAEIDTVYIIFPNASFAGSGGNLRPGDKMNLGYFPANTEIGWVLISDGWGGKNVGVTSGDEQYYSIPELNPEADPTLQQHNILLFDEARDLTVLGFEDTRRDGNCDNDFNDVLFYVTSNPASAVSVSNVSQITYTGDDSDGDGISDPVDDYPDDAARAYDNYYPALNTFGSLAFEDLWPNTGDYDFNDLVVDYYFTEVLNASNEVVELKADFVLKATGASYENGFGFELGITPDQVASITGSQLVGSVVNLAENGTELNQAKAVCMVFDNVYGIVTRPQGFYVNTQTEAPHVNTDTVNIVISFAQPQTSEILGTPPYNPFIFVNQDRSREVHLAEHPPTSLAEGSAYFGSGDDNSVVSGYYKTSNNLPWALDIVETLSYPLERVTIDEAHNYFIGWAETSGGNYADWFKDKPGYRISENIY